MLSKQSNVSSKKLIAFAVLASSVSGVQQKWWGFPHMASFGQSDDFPHFGGGGFMHMPSFDDGFSAFGNIEKDMEKMQDSFKVDPSHGNVHSESFSSQSSSEMGEDGKMHTKESKEGSQKECRDGKCVIKECANGVCKEREADADKSDQGTSLSAAKDNFGSGFGLVENRIQNSMKSMGDHFKHLEQDMANTFKDAESNLEHGLEAGNGNVHSESFSSSSSSQMGEDGKMHSREQKSGTQIECQNGICKQVECKNGVCREMMKDESSGQLLQGQQDPHYITHNQPHHRQHHHRREQSNPREQPQQMKMADDNEQEEEEKHVTHKPEFAPKNKK